MDVKRVFMVPGVSGFGDVALLLLRVTVGAAFMFHGWPKIQTPFDWMGPDGFAPGPFQALAAVSEFCGGAALILGLVTPLAALGILCTMGVALYHHVVRRGDPFVGSDASWELAAAYFCVALTLMALGPGRVSVDRGLFGQRQASREGGA